MKKILAVILTVIIAFSSITMVSATSDARLIGDVNNDGAVSIEDATIVQKYLANMVDFDDEARICADTDGNGAVSIEDATIVQKYLAGMINDFPANQPDVPPTEPTTEPTTAPTEPTTKPETVTPNEMEMEIFNLVNEERTSRGIKPLKFGYFYYEAAQTRAKEVDICFAHIRPDGSDCFTAVEEIGIPVNSYRYAGENCARYYTSAESVMNDFMNSKAHKQNILTSDFDYLAVAVYESKKYPGYYTVEQLFLSDEIDWTTTW